MGSYIENPYSLTLDDLNKFDLKKYNSLQEVEEADRNLKQKKEFEEFLQKVRALTEEHNIELGLRLIHKHIFLEEEGTGMVEKNSDFNNRPAFITSADFINDNTYPASWLVEKNNKYFVFEYSTDPHVKQTLDRLVKDSFVLERIAQLIKQYSLESLIAPCIHAREALVQFDQSGCLIETTYSKPLASVVQSSDSKANDAINITTLWGAPVTQKCFRMIRCEREGDYHNKSIDHQKKALIF